MGCVNFILKCCFGIIALILVLLFVPGIPPHVNYVEFDIEPSLPRDGPFAKNYILDGGERLFEGQLNGPESMASRAINELFVSLHNGSIARIWGHNFEKAKIVTTIGPKCAGSWEEHICGRPLGLRFWRKKLFLVDSYLGIFELDVDTGEKGRLLDPNLPIDGVKPKIINDLDVDESGNIYWSDSSTNVILSDGLVELLSEPSGRLIKYERATKKCEVLLTKLHFSNGVQLSPDNQFVLVTETFRHRVIRYWLEGPKAGTSDIFVSRLPGMPDNIRPRIDGGYYISLVGIRSPDMPDFQAMISKWTGFRKVIVRAHAVVQSTANLINSYIPNKFSASLSYKIFHMSSFASSLLGNETIVVETSESGDIIGSLQGSSGVLTIISETQQVGNSLFFGSPFNNFLGRLQLDKKEPKKPVTKTKTKTKTKDKVKPKEEL